MHMVEDISWNSTQWQYCLKQALEMKNTFLAGYQEIFFQMSQLAYFVLKNIPMHFEVVQCEILP